MYNTYGFVPFEVLTTLSPIRQQHEMLNAFYRVNVGLAEIYNEPGVAPFEIESYRALYKAFGSGLFWNEHGQRFCVGAEFVCMTLCEKYEAYKAACDFIKSGVCDRAGVLRWIDGFRSMCARAVISGLGIDASFVALKDGRVIIEPIGSEDKYTFTDPDELTDYVTMEGCLLVLPKDTPWPERCQRVIVSSIGLPLTTVLSKCLGAYAEG